MKYFNTEEEFNQPEETRYFVLFVAETCSYKILISIETELYSLMYNSVFHGLTENFVPNKLDKTKTEPYSVGIEEYEKFLGAIKHFYFLFLPIFLSYGCYNSYALLDNFIYNFILPISTIHI